MQKIVKFDVSGDIEKDLKDYLDENTGESFISLTPVNNEGDEVLMAIIGSGNDGDATPSVVGNLENLTTNDKSNIVASINEVNEKVESSSASPEDVASAVSDYLDEHGVVIETDATLSEQGVPADAEAVGSAIDVVADAHEQTKSNVDSYLNSWEDVYSFWKSGYYYDDTNDYTYTQIGTEERAWSTMVVCDITSSTPPDKLIPVVYGEIYKVTGDPIYMDSRGNFIPSVVFFDTNQDPVEGLWLRKTVGDQHRGNMEFVIPNGVEYMAVVGITNIYKKVHDTLDRAGILNAINSHYRIRKTTKKINPKLNFDKGYICIGTDDLRCGQTKHLHEMFSEYEIPYYMATITGAVQKGVIGDPYHTNLDYMNMCVNDGGEIIVHSGDVISADNCDDFDFLYRYFYKNKKELEFYGFSPKGIYKAGGTNMVETNTPKYEAWASYFYDFADLFSVDNEQPYRMGRYCLEWLNDADIDAYVTRIIENHEPFNFFTHSDESDNEFAYLMEKLSEYTRGVDYEFITPSELYAMIMSQSNESVIEIDTELDSTSTNPVTNAAITEAIGDIESALEALR